MLPITGYADRWSVKPGETIRFMVGVQGGGRYRARVARIHCGDPNPQGPGYRETPMPSVIEGEHDGLDQPMRLGSFVRIPRLELGAGGRAIGFAATVWPTLAGAPGTVLEWRGGGVTVTLGVGTDGAFCRVAGPGGEARVATGAALTLRAWHDIACVVDPASGRVTVAQRPRQARLDRDEKATASAALPAGIAPGGAGAASIAASLDAAGVHGAHFNGKIEAPRIAAIADTAALLAAQSDAAALDDIALGFRPGHQHRRDQRHRPGRLPRPLREPAHPRHDRLALGQFRPTLDRGAAAVERHPLPR
jgi:N,N-dimethylformamidase